MNLFPSPASPVHEWTRLREVIVGRPHYRIVEPFPEDVRERIGAFIWGTIADKQGQLLSDAFPKIHRRTVQQMDAAAQLLRERGVRVREIPAFEPHEDVARIGDGRQGSMLCFPRDLLLSAGGRLMELAPVNPLRRKEMLPLRRLLDRWSAAGEGAARVSMPDTGTDARPDDDGVAYLEGGDCLLLGREVLVGMSGKASNAAGIGWLRRALGDGWRVTEVPLAEEFPHLDVALALVRPGLGIRCLEAFPEGLPSSLDGWEWVDVGREETRRRMAVNVLPLDAETTLVVEEAPEVAEALTGRGQAVLTTPFSGIAWMGGGPRCWTQPLVRED